MSDKTCKVCKETKHVSNFHRHNHMKDGRLNTCKDCRSKYNKKWAAKNKQSITERNKKWRQDKADHLLAYNQKYQIENRPAYLARTAVSNAIKDGRLVQPNRCSVCDALAPVDAHHDDYLKPLKVRWLCRICHKAWHAENGDGLNKTSNSHVK